MITKLKKKFNIIRNKLLLFFRIETPIQQALRIVTNTVEEDWITGAAGKVDGPKCFIGHLYMSRRITIPTVYLFTSVCIHLPFVRQVDLTITDYIQKKYSVRVESHFVNDRSSLNGYNQPTPRQRMIALLTDMVKDGY